MLLLDSEDIHFDLPYTSPPGSMISHEQKGTAENQGTESVRRLFA